MKSVVPLVRFKDAYQSAIEAFEKAGGKISPESLVRLSMDLYQDIKVKEISGDPPDDDMLLFQYGTYNWHDEDGEHFSFDITRQLAEQTLEGEVFQLSWKLIYDPESFKELTATNAWSIDFSQIRKWEAYIKSTPAFKRACILEPRMAKLSFNRV